MSLQIPLSPLPAQRVSVVLASQNVQLNVFQKADCMYVDVAIDGTPIVTTKAARNRSRLLLATTYRGFVGDLVFVDTIGDDQPYYTGLGLRWFLLYLTAAEIAQ
jgi:hypothetical protein